MTWLGPPFALISGAAVPVVANLSMSGGGSGLCNDPTSCQASVTATASGAGGSGNYEYYWEWVDNDDSMVADVTFGVWGNDDVAVISYSAATPWGPITDSVKVTVRDKMNTSNSDVSSTETVTLEGEAF